MAEIIHEFPVGSTPQRVFQTLATPEGLAQWWTKASTGRPQLGAEYLLKFGPGYDWAGEVTRYVPDSTFELKITRADSDWMGTRVGFELRAEDKSTRVRFYHTGWPTANEHWRVSCYCWAMYLRIMRRYVEHCEVVPYEERLEV